MARKTLRWRLTLLFGTTIVLVVALVGWFVSRQMSREMFIQARRAGLALAGSISAAASNDFFSYNYVALEQVAEEATWDPDVAYVILYDKEGQVAAFSGQGRPDLDQSVPPLPPDNTDAGNALVSNRLLIGEQDKGLDIVVPVTMPGAEERWGTVRLGMKLDRIYRQIERTRLVIFGFGMAGILLGWILAALFTRRITVPLMGLVAATREVSEGNYAVNLNVRTGDEIQDLAERFNWMVARITEQRKSLEENLEEITALKHFSDLIILSITNGLVTLDEEGIVATFNRKAEQILAMDASKVLGSHYRDLWMETGGMGQLAKMGIEQGRTVSGLRVVVEADGQERLLNVTTAPVRDLKARRMGLLILFEDLTEKRDLEERLRRTDRLAAMGTLAAGLAHEIKNPLTAVRAFVQMAPEKFGKPGFKDKFMRIVPRELERVNELLEDLLDLVRKPKLKIDTVRVADVLDHVLGTLAPEVEKRAITVRAGNLGDDHRVKADESYLIRAFHNIVLNAVQAMPSGGTLTIETHRIAQPGSEGAVEVSITDTGPGVPPDQVKDIFNPFFTSKETGTGLGLAVTNKIVEDQGGSIRVESERGRGTTFTVALSPSPDNG